LDCEGTPADPLDGDTEVDVDHGAIVDNDGVVVASEAAMPSGIEVSGVVVPPVMADGELGVDEGLNAKDTKIATIAKAAAIPMPFCRRRTSILNSLG